MSLWDSNDGEKPRYLILETKGYDPLKDMKAQAAERWVQAVNADGGFGVWSYAVVTQVEKVGEAVSWAALAQAKVSFEAV